MLGNEEAAELVSRYDPAGLGVITVKEFANRVNFMINKSSSECSSNSSTTTTTTTTQSLTISSYPPTNHNDSSTRPEERDGEGSSDV